MDKASNNFTFTCKAYYVNVLLDEINYFDNQSDSSAAYAVCSEIPEDVINQSLRMNDKFGLPYTEKEKSLPIMYWMPKLHKSPSGKRFIVASSTCSTKPLSKAVSNVFNLIFKQIRNFHRKSKFYSRYNKFWIVDNTQPVIDKLTKLSSRSAAKNLSTFDFTTLYTKIDHNDLIQVLNSVIDKAFKGGRKKYISFVGKTAFWVGKTRSKQCFSKSSLKEAVKFLIESCYFTVGNLLVRQTIGIPMGIDPAPFWANLYLHWYEDRFMSELISRDKVKAITFNGNFRFIDDLLNINGGNGFLEVWREIYPDNLELKLEHLGNKATFLDLEIEVVDGKFKFKLYDKRDSFNFYIVRMPHLDSNIPPFTFYGSVFSEFLRIARCSSDINSFISTAHTFFNRMKNQGGNIRQILGLLEKIKTRYPDVLGKYRMDLNRIKSRIRSGN